MKLYICEKPSQAADIAKVLGNARKTSTHWETDGGRVTWCFGHLLELAEPEDYDARFKRWEFADLPILPEKFRYIPKTKSTDQLRAIGGLLRDCSSVVIATDADPEGEMVGREVALLDRADLFVRGGSAPLRFPSLGSKRSPLISGSPTAEFSAHGGFAGIVG